MELKYIGPKAVISQHGISFREGKDDKYVYINQCIQIFNAINHEYQKNIIYSHHIENKEFSSDEIIKELIKKESNFEYIVNLALHKYKELLQSQENDVSNKITLSKDEKLAFKNNLIIMKSYRTQRFINKTVYEYITQAIANKLVENKIKEIRSPFNERFWHILQTIQGNLSQNHKVNSTLETTTNDEIIIILKINKIY